jgi:hypothetical protein
LRFTVEALFLALLAAALTIADLEPSVIVGLMLVGWVVVALYEWAATRERPYYGRGLPPRYYVPQVSLPPPRPLEQLPSAYNAGDLDDDTPTWIASPALREEMLGGWPVEVETSAGRIEDTVVDGRAAVVLDGDPAAETRLDLDEEADDGDVVAPAALTGAVASAGLAGQEEAEPVGGWELPADEDESASAPAAGRELLADEDDAVGEPLVVGAAARHQFDPLALATTRRRLLRRRAKEEPAFIEVSAGPPVPRALPRQSRP